MFPGDELEFEGNVVHEGSGYAIAEVKGRRAAASCVCDARLTYRIVPFPNPQFRTGDFSDWASAASSFRSRSS